MLDFTVAAEGPARHQRAVADDDRGGTPVLRGHTRRQVAQEQRAIGQDESVEHQHGARFHLREERAGAVAHGFAQLENGAHALRGAHLGAFRLHGA